MYTVRVTTVYLLRIIFVITRRGDSRKVNNTRQGRGYNMRKIRKVLAFILLLALSVTALTACGSKDDEKEQEKKPKIVKGSLKDMMDEIQKTESGTLHMEITFDTPSKSGEDQGGKMELDYEFDKKNSESSMSLKLNINAGNEKINFGPVDLLREKNEKLYFNLGIINEIAKDLCSFFHQESVLITENLVRTYYVSESLQ